MNHIVFENSTISDVLTKAARVAPKENSAAFTKAPGLYIFVTNESVIVRSTDTEIYYTQWTAGIEKSAGEWVWHVTSRIATFCKKLPIGTGKNVTFSEDGGMLKIQYGTAIMNVPLIKGFSYPEWEPFDSDKAVTVTALSEKIDQVQWAAALASDEAIPALSGVFLDGDRMMAASRVRAASTPFIFEPCKTKPITIPHKIIAPMLRNGVDIKACVIREGIGFEPDDYSQIMVTAYADNPASGIAHLPNETEYSHKLSFNTQQFTEILQRMTESLEKFEHPLVKIMIANEMAIMTMKGKKDEIAKDTLEIPGYGFHEPVILSFNPEFFLRAISNTPSHTAELFYGSNGHVNLIKSGEYKAWIAQKLDINE